MISTGKRRRSGRRRERRPLLLLLRLWLILMMMMMMMMMMLLRMMAMLMRMLVMMMMVTMMMAMMMLLLLLLLLLNAAVAGRKRRRRRLLDAGRWMLRSARRAAIRQYEALGPAVQYAGGVPITWFDGSTFQRSDDAIAGLILAGNLTIARPIHGLDDRGRLRSVLD